MSDADNASETTARIIEFLRSIGLVVHEKLLPAQTFLPGVRIDAGTLMVDHAQLRWPGDLLHEAGHLAVTPAALRARQYDAVEPDPALAHAGEVEATAWAWAALVHLGLDPEVLFHAGGYHGRSQGLIMTYTLGVHPGAAGLAHAGLTGVGALATGPVYPRMRRWLRE